MSKKNAHWADETAEKIIHEKGEKALYTCASGITPSGTVHIGNFREIISVDLVVRALRRRGKNVRFIYSWDDYDVFRKVPENMPNRNELEQYLRKAITTVPDPWGRNESYARHHEVDVESVLPRVGIEPEYLYQTERYRASLYAEGIKKALEKRGVLRQILDKFRDEEHKIQGEWWPVSVFCDKCGRDETEILNWNGEWTLNYRCLSCKNEESVDLRSAKGVKLLWRVDWPMRWAQEQVDFEPAGKDHHSQGGSFDTSRLVCKQVYNFDAPVTFRYDFIGIKGKGGKMSSSKGEVIDLPALLKVYTPELVRYIFAGTRPNTEFTISFDLDVIKIYEDYDRTERIAFGVEKAKNEEAFEREKRVYELSQINGMPSLMPLQAPFRHLCNLLQIADGDIEKCIARLNVQHEEQIPRLKQRCECAINWLSEDAPPEFCFKLRGAGEKTDLNEAECAAIRDLRDNVAANINSYTDDKSCAQAIYDVAERAGMDAKALFNAVYRALIGKEQGPRLASFLRIIGRERLVDILSAY
ncbi:MAG: lysine--tRNA ligase [Spirochaetaceae bacterium]|jgi:lysyl-tRNA synthetase class 1|nr:lysine--tRNA ligase [Spirochaetaceae bacterium]GMO28145.1 MAG: lysine--tRNA ligase [Termitinemataceae bacterium]